MQILIIPGETDPTIPSGFVRGQPQKVEEKQMFEKLISAVAGVIALGLLLYVGVLIFTHLPK